MNINPMKIYIEAKFALNILNIKIGFNYLLNWNEGINIHGK